MSFKPKDLEKQIYNSISDKLSADRKLSKKAVARIEKSAAKLSERLSLLFEQEDKKAKQAAADDISLSNGLLAS